MIEEQYRTIKSRAADVLARALWEAEFAMESPSSSEPLPLSDSARIIQACVAVLESDLASPMDQHVDALATAILQGRLKRSGYPRESEIEEGEGEPEEEADEPGTMISREHLPTAALEEVHPELFRKRDT